MTGAQAGSSRERPGARAPWTASFRGALTITAAATGAVAELLALHPGTQMAKNLGNAAQLLAALLAAGACARAARRGGPSARGWALLAVAAAVWAAAAALWAGYGLTRDHDYPFPSVADIGFLGYAGPVVAGLLMFPRQADRLVSRLRPVLDGLVIATSILFVSWATVLGPLFRTGGSGLTRLTGLAYPVADMVVASLVLTLGVRAPEGARLPWMFLGGGLVCLTVSDSAFVSLNFAGAETIGTVVQAGWVAAFLLIATASVAPAHPSAAAGRRHFSVAQELLPYVPFGVAVVVAALRRKEIEDPFLLWSGLAALLAVAVHQVTVAFEKVTLANDLEAKVERRTSELRTADERFRALVNNSSDVITVMDRDGRIRYLSPSMRTVLGHEPADLEGSRWFDLVEDGDAARVKAQVSDVTAGRPGVALSVGARLRHSDGSVRDAEIKIQDLLDEPSVRGVVLNIRDVTERRRNEAELAAARNEALEASRLKSEFLATMSHEIRTPMNGVIGLTGLLLDTALEETQRQFAEGIRGAGDALLSLINDILDFSKLEAGRVELDLVDFDPRLLLDEVGTLLAESARGKRLELVVYCLPDVPARLRGDAGRIRQILVNLVSNAVKFTASGEVVVRVRARPGLAGDARDVVRFEVTDTGIGIPPADHERLFEPFAQADASTTRRYGGTGLGLAICRRLTAAMGGDLGLHSVPGQGSTFWFTVPLMQPVATGDVQEQQRGVGLPGLRVLVVDDNETHRSVLVAQLSSWRMLPAVATDGPTALVELGRAAAEGAPYAVAIIDLCMPEMDGMTLARRVSADPALRLTRLLLLTSTAHIDAAAARGAGFQAWLSKPVRHSELYDRLVHLVAPRGTAPPRVASRRPAPRAVPGRRGRVLVVEDNQLNQLVAEGVVAKLGYQVDVVSNGVEALDALASTTYSAVLMDCHMPDLDGFEATREIRRREGTARHTPVIAMTAGALPEYRERCLAAGMDDFVSKPVDVTALETALSNWAVVAGVSPTTADEPDVPGVGSDGPVETPVETPVDAARLDVLRALGPQDGWGLLPAVVGAFLDDRDARLALVRDAWAAGGGPPLQQAAHQLKGAAANVGATGVAAVCDQLEAAGRSGGGRPDADLVDRLASELDRAARPLAGAVAGAP